MSAAITLAALAVVGAGYSAVTAYQNGKAIQRLNNANALAAEQDAMVAQRDAAIQANATRQQNERIKAKQRAAFAANGVVGETGSPLLIESETAGYLEQGALEVERQGGMAAGKLRQQAVFDRMAGKSAAAAGQAQAVSTIINGSSQSIARYKGL